MSKHRRKRKIFCAYCTATRSSLLSLAIHQKLDHNRDSKHFLELENHADAKKYLKPILKNGIRKVQYEYQFSDSKLGVIPFYSH